MTPTESTSQPDQDVKDDASSNLCFGGGSWTIERPARRSGRTRRRGGKEGLTSTSTVRRGRPSFPYRARPPPPSPPTSLQEHALRKPHFSVSDLVSPSWCEYSFQYGVLGMSHLPPSQRPESILTPSGVTLKSDRSKVEVKEKVLEAGKAIHSVLEDEAHPDRVTVRVVTREDEWGLRLLNLITSLKILIPPPLSIPAPSPRHQVCCREVPVFGRLGQDLVLGVVDEITRRPVDLDRPWDPLPPSSSSALGLISRDGKRLTRARTVPSKVEGNRASTSSTLERFGFTSVATATASTTGKGRESNDPDAKRGSGDEDRTDGAAPRKKDPMPPPPTSNEHRPVLPPSSEEQRSPCPLPDRLGFAFFLSDTKTRVSRSLPQVSDQYQARLQCMLYKRLFDGMVLGALKDRGLEPERLGSQDDGNDAKTAISADPLSTPLDWTWLFEKLKLDPEAELSSQFASDAEPVCSSHGLKLLSRRGHRLRPEGGGGGGGPRRRICTLREIQEEVVDTLVELVRAANVGYFGHVAEKVEGKGGGSISTLGALHEELEIVYRHQSSLRGGSVGRTRNRAKVRDGDERLIRKKGGKSTTFIDLTLDEDRWEEEVEQRDEDVHLLGTSRFKHESTKLQEHLDDTLAMWRGEREIRGVSEKDSGRCHHCEWIQGCEWREMKSKQREEEILICRRRLDEERGRRRSEAREKREAWIKDRGENLTALVEVEIEGGTKVGEVEIDGPRSETEMWSEFKATDSILDQMDW
ncbi:hypothetical protein IE53DRAFT_328657 [Violaceomyces palustris]|uniref:Uncharacterized protein n=1 Tax=Violaceomyces palustris TaxID=1673888 RepID=A0ACD0P042_9BASI|nr:hypothetical protein IE53DRAFT_328657 [Violaceomyces palustris]